MGVRRVMDVRWERLDTQVQGVTGLSDVLQLDLSDFCRQGALAAAPATAPVFSHQ